MRGVDTDEGTCAVVRECRGSGPVEHHHGVTRDIEQRDELFRERRRAHGRSDVDRGADVAGDASAFHRGSGGDAHPHCLPGRPGKTDIHAERSCIPEVREPLVLALGAVGRRCVRPRCRAAHEWSVPEGDPAERVVGREQAAVLVGLENPDGEGGSQRIDGVIVSGQIRSVVD